VGVVVRGGALAEIMERDMQPAAVWNRTGTIPIALVTPQHKDSLTFATARK
jgi:hypothetical protein